MNRKDLIRYISFDLLGVLGLVLKSTYQGPYYELVHSYAGNVTASFAVYFVVCIGSMQFKLKRLFIALIALLVVELFEATNGFGVMSNAYDPFDFLSNAIGVVLAIGADILSARVLET